MSSTYYKIPYKEEGYYGCEEEHHILIRSDASIDITSIYDEKGNFIFSYTDTINNNMMNALMKFHNSKYPEYCNCTKEDIDKIRNKK